MDSSGTASDPYGVDVAACRKRQQRLIAQMQRLGVELAIITQLEHVQYLAGPRFTWFFSPCAALSVDGRLTLVAPAEPKTAAADEVVTYTAKMLSTLRNDQPQVAAARLLEVLGQRGPLPKRIGLEFATGGHVMGRVDGEFLDLDPVLYELRRRKDPDEAARLRKAIAGTVAMHAVAREIIAPGLNELEMFNQLQAAAVLEYGEMLTGTGNDYASGVRGGPPRNRQIEAGELYILDLGPAFRGYFADNCRAYAVNRQPTDEQSKAAEHIRKVFAIVEREVKPGKSCKALFDEAHAWLNEARPWVFDHHLGHGIGLFPHEAPHLNPNWDDTFQAGEVIAVEPGLYGPGLKAGIRLENNYLVTDSGVELLSDIPLEL